MKLGTGWVCCRQRGEPALCSQDGVWNEYLGFDQRQGGQRQTGFPAEGLNTVLSLVSKRRVEQGFVSASGHLSLQPLRPSQPSQTGSQRTSRAKGSLPGPRAARGRLPDCRIKAEGLWKPRPMPPGASSCSRRWPSHPLRSRTHRDPCPSGALLPFRAEPCWHLPNEARRSLLGVYPSHTCSLLSSASSSLHPSPSALSSLPMSQSLRPINHAAAL